MKNHNKDILRCGLGGNIEARVYGRDGNLKRVIRGKNTLTTNGLNRLVDMLIDSYKTNTPKSIVTTPTGQTSTLKNDLDFGSKEGEIFGVNVIDWPGRSKSTFTVSGFQSEALQNKNNMFNNDFNAFSKFCNGYAENQYWTPGGETNGWICDFGLTSVVNENFSALTLNTFYDLLGKNLKYNTLTLKNNDLSVTYVNNVDYVWQTGDGDSFGKVKVLKQELVGVPLRVSYYWFDVPQVPVVGFMMEFGSNGSWSTATFFNAWRWSLNQGQSRTGSFFPFYSGNPSQPGWQTYYYDYPWYPSWTITDYNRHAYFISSYPWAVKNPTQLAWFGNHASHEKYVFDFQLLGVKMPKLGAHCIGLGDGTGTPSAADTSLFSQKLKVVTRKKANDGASLSSLFATVDFDDGNGVVFREAGLFYPSNDSVYFKEDSYWSGAAEHVNHIIGSNKILRLSQIDPYDCDMMMSHAIYDTPWTKNSDERVEIHYNLNVVWG